MFSAIEQLPTELVESIASYLDAADDYGSLRLASQRLEAASFAQFTNRYITRLTISLDPPKLRKFEKLLWREPLANSIEHIVIDMDDHGAYNLEKIYSETHGGPAPGRTVPVLEPDRLKYSIANSLNEKARLYSDVSRSGDQSTYLVDMLAQALERCKKLYSIRFYFNGHYVVSTRQMHESSLDIYQAICFKATLDAVIKSGINLRSLSSVEDGYLLEADCSIIPYTSFLLPLPYLLQLKKAFVELRSISLCLNIVLQGFSRVPGWEHGTSQFLSTATNLEHLSLYLASEGSIATPSVAVVRSLATTTSFPNLLSFRLGGAKCEENDLKLFIQNHSSSLRELVLGDVTLSMGTWKSLIHVFRDGLELKNFHFYRPWQDDPPRMLVCPGFDNPLDFSIDVTNTDETNSLKDAMTCLIENSRLGED